MRYRFARVVARHWAPCPPRACHGSRRHRDSGPPGCLRRRSQPLPPRRAPTSPATITNSTRGVPLPDDIREWHTERERHQLWAYAGHHLELALSVVVVTDMGLTDFHLVMLGDLLQFFCVATRATPSRQH
uniref:Uncharacterized protein n=1 Tax=Mycobacterium leprae TaxID=1769 RepID=O32964_MYCLR|nr:hypothetical protein MLCB22.25 [Mycobacterium leprae]